ARANVSKGTVALIARGRRIPEPEDDGVEMAEPPEVRRCPTCGVLVQLPCVACRTQRYLALRRRLGSPSSPRPVQGGHPVAGLVYCRWRPTSRPRRPVA